MYTDDTGMFRQIIGEAMKKLIWILILIALVGCTANPVSEPETPIAPDTTERVDTIAPEVLELRQGDMACLIVGRMSDTVTLELDMLEGHRKAKVIYPDGESAVVDAGSVYPLEWCEK
jgi:tartrate dehydratase beta subunit/fumarate hydratase class I family protein